MGEISRKSDDGLKKEFARLMRYDPHKHVDADAWLELDESERTHLAFKYHRRKRIQLPNENLHATIHVIVENQVALGDAYPAKAVLLRLMSQGLDRHDAIHAIGSVVAKILFAAISGENVKGDLDANYVQELRSLSADSWKKEAPGGG